MRVCDTMVSNSDFYLLKDENSNLTTLELGACEPFTEILNLPDILVSFTWKLAMYQFLGFL